MELHSHCLCYLAARTDPASPVLIVVAGYLTGEVVATVLPHREGSHI